MTQCRRWAFTWNNYSEENWSTLTSMEHILSSGIRYLTVSKECGAQGTSHLQGYLEFVNKKRLNGVKNALGSQRVHVEIARGTAEQNLQYVMKESGKEGFENYTYGVPVKQGARQDLMRIRKKLAKGESVSSILQRKPGLFTSIVRYRRGLESCAADLQPERDFKTQICWFYGETGTGKSTRAYEIGKLYGSCWFKPDSTIWFDGYAGERVVVWDDIRGGIRDVGPSLFLRIMDQFPVRVQRKVSL